LIGINLLREGLDLRKSRCGHSRRRQRRLLRSAGSLIQTIGRCARNLNGRAILYADRMTDSMKKALDETNRRRAIQQAYNEETGSRPNPSSVARHDISRHRRRRLHRSDRPRGRRHAGDESQQELDVYIGKLESDMREAAKRFEFEKAAKLRDRIKEIRTKEFLFA